MPDTPIKGRALEALRALILQPRGMQLARHPTSMQALAELGYVVKRQARWEGAKPGGLGWFIAPAGRELMKALGERDQG